MENHHYRKVKTRLPPEIAFCVIRVGRRFSEAQGRSRKAFSTFSTKVEKVKTLPRQIYTICNKHRESFQLSLRLTINTTFFTIDIWNFYSKFGEIFHSLNHQRRRFNFFRDEKSRSGVYSPVRPIFFHSEVKKNSAIENFFDDTSNFRLTILFFLFKKKNKIDMTTQNFFFLQKF